MHICLIYPRAQEFTEVNHYSVPHGLLQLHAELKRAGHNIDIVDYTNPNQSFDYERFNAYDLIGMSVMTTQLKHAIEIVESLHKQIPVVWGGVHTLLDPHSLLNRFPNHFIIRGEGEDPIVKLTALLESGKSITELKHERGFCFKIKDEIVINDPAFISDLDLCADIDYLSLPEFEKYLPLYIHWFNQKFNVLPVMTARFCHWNCSFCINTVYRKQGGQYRRKSITKIRRETERFIDEYAIDMAMPWDEDFFMEWDFVEQWMAYAKEKNFLWGANGRFNYFNNKLLTEANLHRLAQHNCYSIAMSIEAGNEKIRNTILKKNLYDSMIYKAVDIFNRSVKNLIAVNTSFIAFFPGDTPENRIQTIVMMDDLSRKFNISYSGPQIYRSYPGSDLYDKEEDKKYGDIDYYLHDIDYRGTSKASQNKYEAFFYGFMLQYYFNQRYRYLVLNSKGNHEIKWHVMERYKRRSVLLQILFLPISFRIKFKFWHFFIDPTVLGFFCIWTYKIQFLKKLARNILNKK